MTRPGRSGEPRTLSQPRTTDESVDALREAEARYRTIFELAGDAMFVHDARTGAIVDANRQACALAGCSKDELGVSGLLRLSSGDGPEGVEQVIELIRRAGAGEPQQFEWRLRTPSGEPRWVEVRLQSISLGGADHVLAAVRDVHERKMAEAALHEAREELERRVEERTRELEAEIAERRQAEAELQRREEHFRMLIENSSDVASILDPSGINIYQSPSGERVLGYRPEEMVGTSTFERIHPDDRELARRALEGVARRPGTTATVELRYRHRNGGWRILEASGRTLLPDSVRGGIVINSRDVTERRRTNDQIRFQKALLEAQGEASIDGILMVSPTGEILSCNRRFREIWGLPDEILEGRSDREALGHAVDLVADPEHFAARVEHLYAHPEDRARDEIPLRDGRVLDRYSAPVRGTDGVVYGRIWFFRDITEARKAEQALRWSEQRFRSVVENASDLVTLLDPEGVILYQSPAIERTYGYEREELVGRSAFEFVHPEDITPVVTRLSDLVAHPGETRSSEFRFRHKQGHWVHVEAAGTTLSPTTAAEGVVVNSRDITDRKRTEMRLRETTRFLENLIASSPGVIFRGSGETMQTTYISPNSRSVLGFTPEEFLADPHLWVERTHPDDREGVGEKLVSAMESGQVQLTYEYRFRNRSNEYRNLLASVRFERDPTSGETEVLGYTFDVTPLKKAEAALRAAKEEAEGAREIAERANRAKSEFLSRMSHELRTPMNSILGFAQILARRDLPPDQARGVDHIIRGGKHLLNLINEVLDLSRIEANRHTLSLEPVHAGGLLAEALSMMRPTAAQRGCTLDETLPVEADRYVRADRQRLTQVVLNLLSNAIKFNRRGGRVWVSCEVVGRGMEDRLSIAIHDTGTGIAPARMDELFLPFSRLEADEAGIEGTGLGLALSRRLVEAMNGELRVESEEGKGSTFRIELPITDSPSAGMRLQPERAPSSGRTPAPERRPATILYIEDNLANLSLVETILDDRPEIQLIPALQGRLGLELARQHAPDLVLLDLHLPDIPGAEVLRQLRADQATRDTPVVVVSADATPRQISMLRQAGAEEYLTKPLDVERFREVVEGLLAARDDPAS